MPLHTSQCAFHLHFLMEWILMHINCHRLSDAPWCICLQQPRSVCIDACWYAVFTFLKLLPSPYYQVFVWHGKAQTCIRTATVITTLIMHCRCTRSIKLVWYRNRSNNGVFLPGLRWGKASLHLLAGEVKLKLVWKIMGSDILRLIIAVMQHNAMLLTQCADTAVAVQVMTIFSKLYCSCLDWLKSLSSAWCFCETLGTRVLK